jgi:chromosome segregation ATPase
MLEEQRLVLIVPVEKDPSISLKERITKTISSCKPTIDDQYKKNTFYPFLESLILHIVNALAGNTQTAKESKEKIEELENELKLRANTVQKYVEEANKLKANLEQAEIKATTYEKRVDELVQKYNKIELLYKDSENRRNSFQADYSALLEETKSLRKTTSEKFAIERKCNELNENLELANNRLKEMEVKCSSLQKELETTKASLVKVEDEAKVLRSEMQESKKVQAAEEELAKIKVRQLELEEDVKVKAHKISELVVELEKIKTEYVNIKTDYEEAQVSQSLILKKNANDLKEVRRQYAKEKDLAESLSISKAKLEKECTELKDKLEIQQRNLIPAKSVSAKEKIIVEALATRVDSLTEANEKLKEIIADQKKRLENHESESKIHLQLLVNYASKYTQDHLEEFKDAYCFITIIVNLILQMKIFLMKC